MPRRIQRTVHSVPRDTRFTEMANKINASLDLVGNRVQEGIRQADFKRAQVKSESAAIERQGFDQRRRDFVKQYTKEDGSFDFNGAKRGIEKGLGTQDPFNESVLRSGLLFDIAKLQQNEDDTRVENDVLVAGQTARGSDSMVAELVRKQFSDLATTDSSENIDLDAIKQPFIDEFSKQHPNISSEGLAEYESVLTGRIIESYDAFSARRNASRRSDAVDAQVGDMLGIAKSPDTTIGTFTERFHNSNKELQKQGSTKSEIQDFNVLLFSAIIDQGKQNSNTANLDKLLSINASLPESVRMPEGALRVAVSNAKSEINLAVTSAHAKTLSTEIGGSGTVFNLRGLRVEVAQSKFDPATRDHLNNQIERRAEQVISKKRNDILAPVEESMRQSVTPADFKVDENRLNKLADKKTVGLDGKPQKLFTNDMLESTFKALRNAEKKAGVSIAKADEASAILNTSGSLSDLDLSRGSTASKVLNTAFDRQVDDQDVNQVTQYLSYLDRGGVTEHMTDRLAKSLFPQVGVAGENINEAVDGIQNLLRISARYPGQANKIASRNKAGGILLTMARNGMDIEDSLLLISSKSQDDIDEAMAVSSILVNEDDRFTGGGDVINPEEIALYHAIFVRNLVRMRPDNIVGKSSVGLDRNKDGMIYSDTQIEQARKSAVHEAKSRMDVVSIYDRGISIPKNVVNESGAQVHEPFKYGDGEVLTQQVQKIVSAAGLDNGDPFGRLFNFITPGDYFNTYLDEAIADSGRLELFDDKSSGRTYWRMPVILETSDRGNVDLGWIELPTSEARKKELLKP